MGKIVITGGAGFIGSALVWALNQRGRDDLLVVDVFDTSENWQNLARLRFADCLGHAAFLADLENGRWNADIDGIIHMGACSSTTQRDMGYLLENNTEYTRRLARWCAAQGKRFVYASSAATYGDGSDGFADDHAGLDTLTPLNAYAFSKWLFDRWARRVGLLDHIAGLKFFNVYGPNEYHKGDMRSVAVKTYEQIRDTGGMKLFKSHRAGFGDGEQARDFVYVKDAVEATLVIYDRPEANGIFNVGTGVARTFYDLAAAVFAALDRPPQIEFVDMPEALRGKYQYYTCARVDKLRALGLPPARPLEDAVADYVRNYLTRDDPHLRP